MENADMEYKTYQTANLNETAYLLAKKNPLLDAQESADSNIIFLFEKTPKLDEDLNRFYSRQDDAWELLETLKQLKFMLYHKDILKNLIQRFKIQKEK